MGSCIDPVDLLISGRREFGEYGGVNASIEISTTFTVLEADTLPAIFNGDVGPDKGGCYVYGRAFNPTVRHLGRLLAALEECEAAYPCSSGMAAISSTLLALCNSGDHIVASNTVYGGSHALLKSFLPAKAAVHTTFVDITDLAAVEAALRAQPTKVLYTEVVSNPTLRVADLRALAALAHGSGALLVVDNTFTPCVVTPRRLGADIVIHSLTKFASGASDIIAGAVCGSAAFVRSLMDFHTGPCMLLGPTMDPKVASELALRLPHLPLRMQEHGRRAAAFASRLAALGAPVTYPGLPSHPQHALMAAQANTGYGFGGLLGLDLGSPAKANAFMERLQNRHGFGFMAVSLGYFDSLMSLSAASTSSELSDSDMAASGIGRGYVRLSVGITGSLEERWRQLDESYRFVMQLGPADGAAAPADAAKPHSFAPSGSAPDPSSAAAPPHSWPPVGSSGAAEAAPARAATAAAGEVTGAAAAAAAFGAGQSSSGSSDDDDEAEGVRGNTPFGTAVAPAVVSAGDGARRGFAGAGRRAAVVSMAVSAESGNEDEGGGGGDAGEQQGFVQPPHVAVPATASATGSPSATAVAATGDPSRVSVGGDGGQTFGVRGVRDGAVLPVPVAAGQQLQAQAQEEEQDEGQLAGTQRPAKIRRTGEA